MKQNDTVKQRIAGYYPLLWILVKNQHKWTRKKELLFTIELLWITWGDLHEHNERNLYRICNCGIQRRTQNTKKIVDCGRLSTQRNTNETWLLWTVSEARWSTQSTESRADSGLNQRKWKRNSLRTQHKMLHTKNDCGSECRSTQLNWMTRKNEACKNFNARKRTDPK